jgi:hypothetical protein
MKSEATSNRSGEAIDLGTIVNEEVANEVSMMADREQPQSACHPQPGDLILVERSEWYALQDGGLLRVCEWEPWTTKGRDIYVAPRHQVRTFWGPNSGAPDGLKPIYMSTSGGPFRTITLSQIAPLEPLGTRLDTFWRWLDRPRAAGGIEYQQEVNYWKLAWLPDKGTYLSPNGESR